MKKTGMYYAVQTDLVLVNNASKTQLLSLWALLEVVDILHLKLLRIFGCGSVHWVWIQQQKIQ